MPEPEGQIFEIAGRFRRELLRRERAAASEMVRYYGDVWRRIREQVDDLSRKIREAREAGEDVSPAWLFQQRRLESLRAQVEAELRNFARFTEQRILEQQAEAVAAAQEHAEQLALAGLGELPEGVQVRWERLPNEAVQDLVGFLQNGSPLRSLLDELPDEAGQAVGDALVRGVALGLNPREVARQVRREMGMSLARALRIARTETLRAYREATRRSFQANSHVVKGWIWHSALDRRTCAMCWAMHGTKHRLDERLDDHPNGRCAMIPITATWAELGFKGVPETRLEVEPGAEVFARQPEEVQRAVLGNAAYEAYRAGAVSLQDFVGRRRSREWGTTRYGRSLREILGSEEARRWMQGRAGNVPVSSGGSESPRARVERLIQEGKISREAVAEAERCWRERLSRGIELPSGEIVRVTFNDLYHVIVDRRILLRPERIEAALTSAFEIRTARQERRLVFSRWREGEAERLAVAVLDADFTLKSLHLIDERRLQRYTRHSGDVLWKR